MYFKLILVALVLNQVLAQNVRDVEEYDVGEEFLLVDDKMDIQKAPGIPAMLINGLNDALNSVTILRLMMNNYKHPNVSSDCQLALSNMTDAVKTGNMAVLPFVDATAKLPSGIAQGTITFMGSFDQCLNSDFQTENVSLFHGKYCSVYIHMGDAISAMLSGDTRSAKTKGVPFRFDGCLPSSCSEYDIEVALNNIKQLPLSMLKSLGVKFKPGVCQTNDVEPLTAGQITAIVIFSILGAFLLCGTILDITSRLYNSFCSDETEKVTQDSVLREVLLSFSLYTNGIKLLNTHQGAESLNAVNGVRFLSMSWVILGHAYYFINHSIIGNLSDMGEKLRADFAFQSVLNGTLSVDSFFFLSGLLVAYVAIKVLHRDGKINWGLYYFHRFWRLTPAYAAIILFTLLFPLIGSGPTWKDSGMNIITNCQKSWWGSLLYINNLYEPGLMCLGHGWYLANDMQFYILSPIILLALYKKPILGMMVNFCFLAASIVTPALIGMKHDYPPTTLFLGDSLKTNLYFKDIYITPYCRMGPYCVGIYAGFYLARKRTLNLSKITKTIIWCLAIACNMSVLYGVFEWNKGNLSSTSINAFYMATHRTAWAMGLGWVVVACATGNGGVVNSILSWKLFVPLGRITYLAYLIHPMIQLAYSGVTRERLIYTDYTYVTMFLGFLVVSFGFAFAASLAVEAPFLGLEKVLLEKVLLEKPKKVQNTPVNGRINGVANKAYNDDSKL